MRGGGEMKREIEDVEEGSHGMREGEREWGEVGWRVRSE